MPITVAKSAGFCFGVKRANEILEKEINARKDGDRIFTLGHFVHNPIMTENLKGRGVDVITPDDLPTLAASASGNGRVTVILRTHGIEKELRLQINEYEKNNPFFKAVDCACPCVSRIHRIVEKESAEEPDDTLVIIIGDAAHPEVKAIKSYCVSRCEVCSGLEELKKLKISEKRIICVAQTTQKITECKLCQNYLLNRFTSAKIYDTICKVTEERQTEVKKLAENSDIMIILGGRESSNTNKLYEISRQIQPSSYFAESPSELPFDRIRPDIKTGITAGASTPDSLIEEAIKAMSEKFEQNTDDFGKILDESMSGTQVVKNGRVVKGTICSINGNEIILDLDSRYTGIISANEISDDPAELAALKKGDEIEALVLKTNDAEGVAQLSKKQFDARNSKDKVAKAYESGEIIEGKIVEVAKNKAGEASGLVMNALSSRFFIPASQTGIAKGEDISVLLGTVQKVKITDLSGRRPVASIAVIAKEQKKAEIDEFWATLEKGQIFEGTVKSMTDYGVFVNIGPVDGMVYKSELSWKRFRLPSDVVSIGDKLTVYVKDLNPEKRRISLGCKTDENNPWNIFTSKYSVDDVVSVKIQSLMTYGAFAEIIDGVDGLIHISKIANKRITNPAEVLHVGDVVDVKIIAIDEDQHQISLSIRDLLEPSLEEEEQAIAEEKADDAE